MKKVVLSVDGMTCAACSSGLEKYLSKQKGIKNAYVNLVLASASIEYDDTLLSIEDLNKFIARAGFKSLGEFKITNDKSEYKKNKRLLFIYTFLVLLMTYISMGNMLGLPQIPFLSCQILYIAVLVVLSLCFLLYGADILISGVKNLVHKMPNMDTLVFLSVTSCFLYSLYNAWQVITFGKEPKLYFDTVAVVIYFVKLGRFIDSAGKDKTKDAVAKLVTITPECGVVKKDGTEVKVTIDEIKKGDVVISKAGEKIAVDGEIINGKAHFDEVFINGESQPVLKSVGEKVMAGSLNYDGYIEYKADKIGKESTVSEIVKMVEQAAAEKAPIAKLADTVSGFFVPVIMALALLTFTFYLLTGYDFTVSMLYGVCVLAAACPCALGLAAPLALVVAEGQCLTQGVLVKKNSVFELAGKLSTIVFDKTGTLTYGKLKIAEIFDYENIGKAELIRLAASLEKASSHPIAVAFTAYANEKGLALSDCADCQNISGFGIAGKTADEDYLLGSAKMLAKFKVDNPFGKDEETLKGEGCSIVYLVRNGKIIGLFGVKDVVRADSAEVLHTLQEQGIKTIMLTGDNKGVAEKVARRLRIETFVADVQPKQKTEVVKRLKGSESRNGRGNIIAMCGDGINDSPALAESDIGISVNTGTDIAMDSADVILKNDDLKGIIKLISISKNTVRIIKQNLFWAFFYNLLMIPAAMGLFETFGIVMNPMLASLAMVLSSTMIILNTLRLKILLRD